MRLYRFLTTILPQMWIAIQNIERKLKDMATQQDVDNAIGTIETAVSKLGDDLTKAIADLTAKIGQSSDFQPEVDRLNAIAGKLSDFDAEAVEADQPTRTPPPSV